MFFQYLPTTVAITRSFLDNLGKTVDHYSEKHENFLLLGDFNMVDTDQQIRTFMNSYYLSNLVQEPTWCKSVNPRCIDLILTNRRRIFQYTTTIEPGPSDFY